MKDTRLTDAVQSVAILAALLCFAVVLFGCASTRQESTVERERIVGVQGGQPTDLTRIRQQQTDEQRKATVDTEEVARVAAEAASKAVNGAIQGAIPGLGKVLAEAVPRTDLAPVLAGVVDAGKLMADLRRDVGEVKQATAPKPTNNMDLLVQTGMGMATMALAGYGAKQKKRADQQQQRADTHERHLDETVAGIEAAKGILPPAEWVRLRNALQTRQSADTQAAIDSKTP